MSYGMPQGRNLLKGWQRRGMLDSNAGKDLPKAYRKFFLEWKSKDATPVHYIPKEGKYVRDPRTGLVTPVQNIPIPTLIPAEAHDQIWGGEGVIKGFQKRSRKTHRVPHFWVPVLKRYVLHSQILNQYMSVVVTDRAMNLIHENQGFDHYLLKTPACDLRQLLPLRIKRQLLLALQNGCPDHKDDPEKQKQILAEYGHYLEQYTPEEIDWYGYSFTEALKKLQDMQIAAEKPVPHKHIFRQQLLETLKAAGLAEAQEGEKEEEASWMTKLNPFSKTTPTTKSEV
ncbi:large ribosomal subunit protein bL28m [Culicoides brevitarsis]|uniref:large ribosomal subunit protein bL28m n=1 Tax=Culicoides brevitarsis TaxID=469753 RepID=UPI00307CB997